MFKLLRNWKYFPKWLQPFIFHFSDAFKMLFFFVMYPMLPSCYHGDLSWLSQLTFEAALVLCAISLREFAFKI